MKKITYILLAGTILVSACTGGKKDVKDGNPFFAEYDTPFGVPPFNLIDTTHYMPAFLKGFEQQKEEIAAIVNNTEEPTFENTILALEQSGEILNKVAYVYYGLKSANTNDGISGMASEIGKLYSAHSDEINLNQGLFNKVKAVYEKRAELNLDKEDAKLLEDTYKGFIRSGVGLDESKKPRLRELNARLSELGNMFGANLLAEGNDFQLVIDKKEDLAGLPEGVIAGAAETAAARGLEGKWVFTTSKPSMLPFLTYAKNRDLRKKLYMGYTMRGNNNNKQDNKKIIAETAKLRVEKANLLGYDSHAAYMLEDRMAKKPENAMNFLTKLWKAALPVAKAERKAMQEIINKEGGKFKLESWDWWYYAEKVRKARYDLDENEVRPYFELNNVRDGSFYTCEQLWGITFNEIKDTLFPKPHADAQVFEVKDKDGSHLAILYMDFHPRASKRSGAWCGVYRKQHMENGKNITPVVTIVCNFSKPVGDTPALLSYDEATTLFHELGHGLHQLFSKNKYTSLSGTSVPRDFVELPSQIMENWAGEEDVLKVYAKHYKTGEVIPAELLAKMKAASKFNQGFATVEYLAASLLDMNFHMMTEPKEVDVLKFEKEKMNELGLIKEIVPRYRTTYFNHIWNGTAYSAGYYSYIWAAVLDADAFEAFKETSLFDQETAAAFRNEVLSQGGTDDVMEMYKRFRGREPKEEALLKRKGLL